MVAREKQRCPRGGATAWCIPVKAKDFTLEKLRGICHNSESTKAKMVEANPSLGRTMTVRPGMEKMLLHTRSSNKKASTVQATLDKCFTKSENPNSQCS